MDAPQLHFSHHGLITKATVDSQRMAVTALLTYPVVDLAGDYIEPTGGDYDRHKALPWVGLEHYRLKKGTKDELVYPDDAGAGRPIVAGWARDSLADEGGEYAVELKTFTIKGKRYNLPVGTTFYDPDNRLSSQVFSMVQQDALPGVSLELAAPNGYTPAVLKARSPLEPHRPAWRYDRWECHAWVNCARPVNPGAFVAKSMHDDILAVILDRKRIVTGNGTAEPLHPLIYKSLARYAPEPNKSRAVVEKAMPDTSGPPMGDNTPDEPTVYDDAHEEQQEDQGPPTAQAAYDFAQMLVDVSTHIEERLKASEHVGGKKALVREMEKIRASAEKIVGIGDKVTADVGKGDGGTGQIDEDEDADVEEDAVEPDEDDEGDDEKPGKKMKALTRNPKRFWAAKSIKRFTLAEIQAAPVVKLIEPDDEPVQTPDQIIRREKAQRNFRRAKRDARLAGVELINDE